VLYRRQRRCRCRRRPPPQPARAPRRAATARPLAVATRDQRRRTEQHVAKKGPLWRHHTERLRGVCHQRAAAAALCLTRRQPQPPAAQAARAPQHSPTTGAGAEQVHKQAVCARERGGSDTALLLQAASRRRVRQSLDQGLALPVCAAGSGRLRLYIWAHNGMLTCKSFDVAS
jgi:hypothetical protein